MTGTTSPGRARSGWLRGAAGVAARLSLGVATLAGTTLVARAAHAGPASAAQASSVEGYVVELSDGDIVVDIAGKRGAMIGDDVELWRPLKLRHPVTGQMITDRFRIGTLRLTQVRDSLSWARPEGKLAREPKAGDIVILRKQAPPPAPALPGAPPASGSAPDRPTPKVEAPSSGGTSLDPEAAEVTRIFESLRGADPTTRIIRYENYVRENPNSRFAVVLYEEAAQLRALLTLESQAGKGAEPALASFDAPADALSGIPVSFGVELTGPATGAVLHSRNAGEVAYTSTPMVAAGDGYYVLTLPAKRMNAPRMDYFIEATNARGEAFAVVGHAMDPKTLVVHDIPTPTPPPRHEATVSVLTDYAWYNTPSKNNDRTWQTEGWFGMRFDDVGVRAVRSGFGVFRGVGGSLDELDKQNKGPRAVGLTYGYLEGEFGFSSFTSLVVRGVLGLRDDGVSGGAQALIRIGNDKETNLMIGGEVLGGIGLRGITQLELNTFQRVPILLRTEVTNQPAGVATNTKDVRPADEGGDPNNTSVEQGEVGARAIVQVGYRVMPTLVLAVRGSYQGRTINHAGPGFGGAVTYSW